MIADDVPMRLLELQVTYCTSHACCLLFVPCCAVKGSVRAGGTWLSVCDMKDVDVRHYQWPMLLSITSSIAFHAKFAVGHCSSASLMFSPAVSLITLVAFECSLCCESLVSPLLVFRTSRLLPLLPSCVV